MLLWWIKPTYVMVTLQLSLKIFIKIASFDLQFIWDSTFLWIQSWHWFLRNLCDMESHYNIVKWYFVTWYFTKFSWKNVWELFKMQDSPQGKQWLALQRKECHMAEHILSLFPEAKRVARGRKLTIIILPRNWQHT